MTRCWISSLWILTLLSLSSSKSPIIFVPGSFCSLLEVRINTTIQSACPSSLDNQWTVLWLNVRFFEPNMLRCFQEIFRFVYNSSSERFDDPPGVETRLVPRSVNSSFLSGVLWEYVQLDKFFYHFVNNYNYIDGENLHSMPYDFRRGTNQTLFTFVDHLKELIHYTYLHNDNQSVHLISHSTGGSMVLFFLSQQTQLWKDQYIHSWISLSGNLAGEVDNIQSLIQGFLAPVVPRDVLQTWDFFAWRLPEPVIYGSERILIRSPSKNYTSVDLLDLLRDINAHELALIYPQSSGILGTFPAPNVDTYCFFGRNISTAVGYISKSASFQPNDLETIDGWGDGEQDDTTNMSCQRWNQTMDRRYQLFVQGFDRVNHLALVGNDQILDRIDQILFS